MVVTFASFFKTDGWNLLSEVGYHGKARSGIKILYYPTDTQIYNS